VLHSTQKPLPNHLYLRPILPGTTTNAAFYCFNFAVEIIVLYTYLFARFDLRFHVPEGSEQLQHYEGAMIQGWPVTWYDSSASHDAEVPVSSISTEAVIPTINIDIDEKNFI
jgi:hypothetical protein